MSLSAPTSFSGPPLHLFRPLPYDPEQLLPLADASHEQQLTRPIEEQQTDSMQTSNNQTVQHTPMRQPTSHAAALPRALPSSSSPRRRDGASPDYRSQPLSPRYANRTAFIPAQPHSPSSRPHTSPRPPTRGHISPRRAPASEADPGATPASPEYALPLALRQALLRHQTSPTDVALCTSHDPTATFLAHSPPGRAVAHAEALARVDAVIRDRLDEAVRTRTRSKLIKLDALYVDAIGVFGSPRPVSPPVSAPLSARRAADRESRSAAFTDPMARFRKLAKMHAARARQEEEKQAEQDARHALRLEQQQQRRAQQAEIDRAKRAERARVHQVYLKLQADRQARRAAEAEAAAQAEIDAAAARKREHADHVAFIVSHQSTLKQSPASKEREAREREKAAAALAAQKAEAARWVAHQSELAIRAAQAREAKAAADALAAKAAEEAAATKREEALRAKRARDERILAHMVNLSSEAAARAAAAAAQQRRKEEEAARHAAVRDERTLSMAQEARRKAQERDAANQAAALEAQQAEQERKQRLALLASSNLRATIASHSPRKRAAAAAATSPSKTIVA